MDALINVVIPVFGVIVTGYLAGRFNVLGPESAAALNRFVYFFALPPVIFVFTARAPIDMVFNWPFIGAFVGASVVTVLIALPVGRLWFRNDVAVLSIQGLTAMGASTAYVGVPLLLTAYGPEGVLPAIVASLVINIFIGSTIAVLEMARAVASSTLRVSSQVSRALVRNPLVVAALLGIVFSKIALPLPKPIGNYLDLTAAAAGPAALFALGLSLVGRTLTGNTLEVAWLVVLKLAVQPLVAYFLVANVFPMDPLWSQAAVLLSALPVATVAFVIAQQYEVHVQCVSTAIVASTAISVVTISFLLIWFKIG